MGFLLKGLFRSFLPAFRRKLTRDVERRSHNLGRQLEQLAKAKVSIPNPDGKSPSAPGEPPRLVTGVGRDSIRYKVGRNVIFLTAVPHMMMLDEGTSRVDPRPWRSVVLRRNSGALGRAFAK